ncbi:MAG: hypothetical protein ACE5FP_11065 [Gemmatimonadota bacterium]
MNGNITANTHLTADELELAAANPAALADEHRRHVGACRRCAAGVVDAREVSIALRSLPIVSPRPGFTERVMARVRLPLPWHRRAVVAARERKGLNVAASTALAALGAGAAVWALQFPDLRPAALAAWIVGQAGDLLWQTTIGLGRIAYALGLTDLLNDIGADLTLGSAVAGLATIALVSIGSLSVMVRLVREGQPALIKAR